MNHRQQYRCWHCNEQYGLLLPEEEVARFIVQCPYCGKEATIELKDYPKKRDIYRNANNGSRPGNEYELPEVIMTQPPE